jgi:N-acetylglutamate synthase-like GNAT family acetyltransferase
MASESTAWLSERPDWVPRLAALHHAQWSPLLKHWTRAEAEAELRSHDGGARIPTTIVAEIDGALAGSVSLLANDDERIREWSPWLASLLVLPEYRGRGIGERLVRRCVALAAQLGVGTLYLYTDDAAAWYAKLGWRHVAETTLDGVPVDVMCIEATA